MGRRPSRNLPRPDYRDYSSESDNDQTFNSVASNISDPDTPLSPSNPHFGYQTSPPPTRQVLQDAAANLRPIEAIQAVVPNWPAFGEETVEGHVVGGGEVAKVQAPPVIMVNFDQQNEVDDAGAMRDACQRLEKVQWDPTDVLFFFTQIESKMKSSGVKNNFTKFQCCIGVLPKNVLDQVKPLLRKEESDFVNNDAYLQLKREVLRIFGPKPSAAIDRALGRVLVGKPSDLARALVDDICSKQLDCDCCPAVVEALWRRQLSGRIRAGIAGVKFSKATFNEITQLADDIHDTQTATVAAMGAHSLDETQPAIQYPVPEVAAVNRGGRGGRGGRGQGRGGRGSRGGAQPSSSGTQSSATGGTTRRGTKHPDLPPGEWTGCNLHFRWGRSAYFCAEPSTCPWRDIFTPRPPKKNKNQD